MQRQNLKILIMGVSGCGKSTIAKSLANKLQYSYLEADDFHPISNVEKMASGKGLNDEDRRPWLESIHKEWNKPGSFILSCSALKKAYRDLLSNDLQGEFIIIYLKGSYDLILERLTNREGHFMPASLLKSQFDTLEEPENSIEISIEKSLEEIEQIAISKIEQSQIMQYDIGVLGLGVMGKSLARNLSNNDLKVSVYNIPFPGEEKVTETFVNDFPDNHFFGASTIERFVDSLAGPKVVLLMIKSGAPVDEMIEKLKPLLSEGDLIIDAGNSFYKDTRRRAISLEKEGLNFVGMGVSGGEEGALKGPSIMPAGTDLSRDRLLPMLEKIAASANNEPCVRWIGKDGAGHFVKMVHNGIEYADMQMITEAYELCRKSLQMSNTEIADLFESWMKSYNNSYLLEISIDILRKKENDVFILDEILDVAGHKGTGLWTSREALEMGVAVPSITAAMNQRIISSFKQNRVDFSDHNFTSALLDNKEVILDILGSGLLAGRLQAMAEGFHLMQVASNNYKWDLNMESIAAVWRGGCIIRSAMLPLIMRSYEENPSMNHLYYADLYMELLKTSMQDLDIVLAFAQMTGIALPCLNAANQYFKSFTTENLPINMIQAQRDYFGAHTYRTIQDSKTPKHTSWNKQ